MNDHHFLIIDDHFLMTFRSGSSSDCLIDYTSRCGKAFFSLPANHKMYCSKCSTLEDRVVDSRLSKDGKSIRRRRECVQCGHRFTTYEEIERAELRVVKRNGSSEPFSRQKVLALLTLARGIDRGEIDLERLETADDDEAVRRLRELRGVGRWTAEYVLLRGLGRLHVFPGDDVGAQKSLARWLGRPGPLDYDGVSKALEKWRPYAGMLYFHLLLDGLPTAGLLEIRGADAAER